MRYNLFISMCAAVAIMATTGCGSEDPPPTLRELLAEQALQEQNCKKQKVYIDQDGDGYGNVEVFFLSCTVPHGYVRKAGDCRDDAKSVNPGAPEICDSVDNNCNGQVDENASKVWYLDHDGDGHGDPKFKMDQGCDGSNHYVASSDDCDDSDADRYPGAKEICDDLDNDCDGKVDNDVEDAPLWYEDYDQDGAGNALQHEVACKAPKGFIETPGDCNDANPAISPNNKEICDNLDNDCDGQTDEELVKTFYADKDGDGYGGGLIKKACVAPKGYVPNSFDCNDHDEKVAPWQIEHCNGKDDDCNGQTDESAVDMTTFYKDHDGDGYGNVFETKKACSPPKGYVPNKDDCDDWNKDAYLGAPEVCDGVDNDCDGFKDESDAKGALVYWLDTDGDGYGDPNEGVKMCWPTKSYVQNKSDCNDKSSKIHPNATEVCDGIDNDCDGQVDNNAADAKEFYWDFDSDGYGTGSVVYTACKATSSMFASNNKDCDDKDNDTYPGAMEICDFEDNDCNGHIDDWCIN